MKRRRFITSFTLAFTGVAIGTDTIFTSCTSGVKEVKPWTEDDVALLNDIGETIIPSTPSSPGAKTAKVGEFMKVYVTDCYTKDNQYVFLEGIQSFKKSCEKKYGKTFTMLSREQKREFLADLDKDARTHNEARQKKQSEAIQGDAVQAGKTMNDKEIILQNADHYFTMIRNLTLFGYFTSEAGATKALRYMQTPGYYAGEIPYNPGDRSWAI